ncbi:MAG TPA: hypothetical protein EYP57_04455 [Thermodesulfobacteriaceae bacterium]|nr:hypothetical protein [Thermodesulfobacteriaceae bacterium]
MFTEGISRPACSLWVKLLILAQAILSPALLPADMNAGSLIQAEYVQAQGSRIVLLLKVNAPAVKAVIITQYLPEGVAITSAAPRPNSFDAKHAKAKWLLRDPGKGSFKISMEPDRPLKAGEVRAEIRFRDPSSGTLTTLSIPGK